MEIQETIQVNGRLLDLSSPAVMGVINVTPDSFYGGSRHQNLDASLRSAEKMLEEGATFLDIGGYSSRPGAADLSEHEELKRIEGPVSEIARRFPEVIISIDTFRAKVAKEAVNLGAAMVNDISAGSLDERMMEVVGQLGVPYIAMHMRGNPQTMKQKTEYSDLIHEITAYFSAKLKAAREAGIKDVIIDPGLGFAKDIGQNYFLLRHVNYFKILERPILIGLSRKSMIYKTLKVSADQALNGTTALNTVALLQGASILRVHDVKEAVEVVKLVNQLSN